VSTAIHKPNGVFSAFSVRSDALFLTPQTAAVIACASAAVGLLAVCSTVTSLIGIWESDALKSVGMAVPFVCFALILRDWRSIEFNTEGGTWWGFLLLAVGVLVVFLRDQSLLIVTVNKNWLLQLPPLPLVAVLYALSFVLMFGGRRLLRAAWFPIALMWAVIPVPQTFSRRIDVPLQHAGAVVARSFAHLIGVRLNSMDLKIMFSPTTGMFIAPGCDGLRGAITMGLTALVVAYYYRFRWFIFLPIVIGGVLLGYLFNFLRLCGMVIYDRFTVSYPALGPHEQLADHIVGGCIFVFALFIFFQVIDHLRQTPTTVAAPPIPRTQVPGWPIVTKALAVLVLATLFGADYLHSYRPKVSLYSPYPAMPAAIGPYHLVRTWLDETTENVVVYTWGEYAIPGQLTHISLGISPHMDVHDAEVCHIAKGDDPTWHGQIDATLPSGRVSLAGVMYNNGVTQKLEASTVCDDGSCQQYTQSGQHVTMVYARPHKDLPLQSDPGRPVPLLLKVESSDTAAPAASVEPRLASTIADFLKQADLAALTMPFGKR
jgi:exosortase J